MKAPKLKLLLVVTPGFENAAGLELQHWITHRQWSIESIQAIKGGLEIVAPNELLPELARCLKIPTRIYIRLGTFSAKNERQLRNGLDSIEWDGLLFGKPKVNYSAYKARLFHKQKMKELAERHLKKKSTLQKDEPQQILIRNSKDIMEVSLDASGELLFKEEAKGGKAKLPLRETVAAGVLWTLIGNTRLDQLREVTLLDPMCGSGTFLLEAESLGFPNKKRKFQFEYMKHWNFEQKVIPPLPMPFGDLHGNDLSEEAYKVSLHNSQGIKQIRFTNNDAFSLSRPNANHLWLVSNPPLGVRLKRNSSHESYDRLIVQICDRLSPERVALLLPNHYDPKKVLSGRATSIQIVHFNYNSIEIQLLTFETLP